VAARLPRRRVAAGSTRPDKLWSTCSRAVARACGGDNDGIVEKVLALLSGHAACWVDLCSSPGISALPSPSQHSAKCGKILSPSRTSDKGSHGRRRHLNKALFIKKPSPHEYEIVVVPQPCIQRHCLQLWLVDCSAQPQQLDPEANRTHIIQEPAQDAAQSSW
jgi:hypothetical protein